MQFRDLHRQYSALKDELNDAWLQTTASGAFIMGDAVADLERQLAAYVGVKYCIGCASGTDALHLALMALGIGHGDAVFVPDFTFFATAEAVAMTGATPIFVDVCRDSYNIDVNALALAVEQVSHSGSLHPAAVIAVDLFGLPADYDALRQLCHHNGLLLVEDGAQGFGAVRHGKKACSFGDISTTSFFPAKPLGCYGDGGALFTNNDEWAALLRSLHIHGKGNDKYDNVRIGLNSRLDTIQAAILRVKLHHFDDELRAVQHVAEQYNDRLRNYVEIPVVPDGICSSWAQYTVRTSCRDMLQASLRNAGIPSMVYYPRTMSAQTAFATLGQQPCRVAEQLCHDVLSLPIHPYLSDEEVEQVAEAVVNGLSKQ